MRDNTHKASCGTHKVPADDGKIKAESLRWLEEDYWMGEKKRHWLHHVTDVCIQEDYVYTTQQTCVARGS